MTEFQEGWADGWRAAQGQIVAQLMAKHGAEGIKVAPAILSLMAPTPPLESQVETMSVADSTKNPRTRTLKLVEVLENEKGASVRTLWSETSTFKALPVDRG